MSIDLNNTTLTNNAGLNVVYGGNTILKQTTAGILQRYNSAHPMFTAGSNLTTAWVLIATGGNWGQLVFNITGVNNGGAYNTSNGRFTAPVTGQYLFSMSAYIYGVTTGWYCHPMFWVNGAMSIRRPAGGIYRIRGHGRTGGYPQDTDIAEIIPLVAGDYVTVAHYAGTYDCNWEPPYARFEGYLLG